MQPLLRLAEPMNQAGHIQKRVHLTERLFDIERDLDALANIADRRRGSSFGFSRRAILSRSLAVLGFETAKCLLNPVGDHLGDDVLGQSRRWCRTEHHAPPPAKCVDAEGPDLVDLGLDRRNIYGPHRHGQAALWPAAAVPDLAAAGLGSRAR